MLGVERCLAFSGEMGLPLALKAAPDRITRLVRRDIDEERGCEFVTSTSATSTNAIEHKYEMFTLYHCLFVVWLQLCMLMGTGIACLVGGLGNFGYGALLGLLAGVAIPFVTIRLQMLTKGYRNRYPRCKNETCAADDYKFDFQRDELSLICNCGDTYLCIRDESRELIRLDELLPDGTSQPYMVRRGRDWVPAEKSG